MKRRNFMGYGAATALALGAIPAQADSHAQEAEAATDFPLADMVLGDPDAPVTIYEYSSFTCPHCKNFHIDVLPQLKADYIDTGKVKLIFREAYFDSYGLLAAMVARCGGEMRYFGIVDMIFLKQSEWAKGDGNEISANLRGIGKASGLSDAQLDACMTDEASAKVLFEQYQASMQEYDINATPTLVVNGVKQGNMPYPKLKKLIEEELAK